jgi:hypothetical protein
MKIYKEKVAENRGNEKVNLYNKYAYDYLYTRDGEEGRGGKQERESGKRLNRELDDAGT